MEKEKKQWKFFSRNTLCLIIINCLLISVIWVALHGIPLAGLPQKEDVQSVTLVYHGSEEKNITDDKNIELLINAANLLNYRLRGETEAGPVISVIYHLKNGNNISIEANNTTMWWHGKSHAIKEPDTFVNIIQGLFFD